MKDDLRARQKKEWKILQARITQTLDRFGRKDPLGKADYWLVDENWGQFRQKLEVQNLNFLRPDIIRSLQACLAGYPDWEIMFRVDIIGKEREWPAMGIIIHDDEIIDDLKREYLPEEFRNIVYEGSKRLVNPFESP
jgi:hypothetical protein